jgi:dipeptidyl-peptidase-4
MSDPSLLTLERIFEAREFAPERHDPGRWLPDGSGYLRIVERNGGKAVVAFDAASGVEQEVILPVGSLVPPGEREPLQLESYSSSEDGSTWLLRTETGERWTMHRATGRLVMVGGAHAMELSRPTLSPGGDRVVYVVGNDLHVQDLATNQVVRLTSDGSATILNGTGEGVYTGLNTGGLRWSPDGTRIAFVQFDAEGVGNFQIVNYTDSIYSSVVSRSHVKPGETLPSARVGIVDVGGGDVTWLELPGDPRNHYVNGFEWIPNADELFVRQLNRAQNTVRVFLADPKGGVPVEILVEREETWLDLHPVEWVDGGRDFLWVSERDGWRHVYRMERDGGNARLLTPGDFDILSVEAVDEEGGWLYFLASTDDPGQRYLYRTRLDGSGGMERVTPQGAGGTHEYNIAPGAQWTWHTVSAIDRPPVTELVSLPGHHTVRVEVENAALTAKVRALDILPTEFFRIDIGGGVELDGWVIKPPDFDPGSRYPVLFYVYGMPAGQTVLDRWGGDRHLFHHFLAQRGYVVMSVDNRGTPAPRGREFRRIIYLQHGVLPARDQATAVRALEARWPWMDPSRIGIYGWSGGGNVSMNAIFRHPDVYSTAMPGAGLSHHRYYHASFTERFLGLPQDNPDAYEATAPVNVAKNLRGNLLIIHGTGDPNVHFQNAEALSNALIAAKKRFTIMPYPNRPHGIPDGYHLHDLYLRFLEDNLPTGDGGSGG